MTGAPRIAARTRDAAKRRSMTAGLCFLLARAVSCGAGAAGAVVVVAAGSYASVEAYLAEGGGRSLP